MSLYGQAIPVAITARHVHLSRAHADTLFGEGYEFTSICPLTQPGEYACAEVVTVRGGDGVIDDVRVVGPLRERTSVELGLRDHNVIGLDGELRLSSRLDGAAGCTLEGPVGTVVLAAGVLNAPRHLHLSVEQAAELSLTEDSSVSLTIGSERAREVRDVVVHIRDGAVAELHLDPEEANAADVGPTTTAQLLRPAD